MVFVRKIKEIQGTPCFVVKMEIDFERKLIVFMNISNRIILLSVQHIENIVNEWRYQFETRRDFSSIAPLSHILYEFSSYEIHAAASMKFSNALAPASLSSSMIPSIKQNIQGIDSSKIMHSFTTISEKSNKRIQVNMLSSGISQSDRNEMNNFESIPLSKQQQHVKTHSEKDKYLYALAVQEAQGNIKILSPTRSINEWMNVANIVYEQCEYLTLDFTWSANSRFLFVVYSNNSFLQYDAHASFTVVKKYSVESALSFKIISNYQNDCIILKSESKSCHLIDITSQRAYTFEIFKRKPVSSPPQGDLVSKSSTAKKKLKSIVEEKTIHIQGASNTTQIATSPTTASGFSDKKQQPQLNSKQSTLINHRGQQELEVENDEEIQKPTNAQRSNVENEYEEVDGDDNDGDSDEKEDLDAFDIDLVDLQVNENIGKYVSDQEISVSRNAEYVCIGSTSDKSVILYSQHCIISNMNRTKQNQTNGFEWKRGFKKHYLSQDKIECSSFSDFLYLPFAVKPSYLTNIKEIPGLIGELSTTIKNLNSHEIPLAQSLLAIAEQNSLKIFAIQKERIAVQGVQQAQQKESNSMPPLSPQSEKLVDLKEFKSTIIQILWISAYSLLLILSDYSLYFVKFSPEDIGYALKTKESQQSKQ